MEAKPLTLKWMNETPESSCGVTWGVPWNKGELKRQEKLGLESRDGEKIAVQSWPTAFWPDGSVKWTAHSASLTTPAARSYVMTKTEESISAMAGEASLRVEEREDEICVHTGVLTAIIGRSGSKVIRALYRDGKQLCSGSILIGLREERKQIRGGRQLIEEEFESRLTRVTVELEGTVRSVILVEGVHCSLSGDREWLPFRLRLAFYANQSSIRLTHTFFYNGDPQQDFIKGIGIKFDLPITGQLYNRHVRFAGDTGFFSESPKQLATSGTTGIYTELHKRQQAGEAIVFDDNKDTKFLSLLQESAVWDSFKMVQPSADYYTISKQTKEDCCWINAVSGQRSNGLCYFGGESGGLAAGVRNFWKKYPSALEMNGLAKDEAVLKIWFWSPDAAAMDLRHYDTQTHVNSAYEGSEELRSTPYGIANTSELVLWCCDRTPSSGELTGMVQQVQSPPLLVCDPDRFHASGVFGVWSLPNRSTPAQAEIEDQLDALISFYQRETEQRKWYGFWDFGDFMHSYDPVRHTWRYDMGGYAWQNTELAPNLWLWLMFIRSGREDIFRMAEAMTRHTSEVDVYHLGEYAGLGSRHNVVHWGCGCKEARIAMAGLHKYYFYLTADERIGDILSEVADADYATVALDPMRAYFPKDQYPTHARSGPDWSAFVSNWLYQWERFERTEYRDKILRGINCLKAMPYRLLSGTTFGYDPDTGELHFISNENYMYHMVISFGAPQIWMELAGLLNDPEWEEMLAEFGAFYHLEPELKKKITDGQITGAQFHWPMFASSMSGYAAARRKDQELAQQTWNMLLVDNQVTNIPKRLDRFAVPKAEFVRAIDELPMLTTNTASQWSLNAILCLELIGQWLPETKQA